MDGMRLNNNLLMPMAGIGVFTFTPAEAEQAVIDALAMGIRLIDTANAYLNEKAVGRAIRKSGVAREDIFLVSKLWPTVYENPSAVDDTLRRLDTAYVDLLFLHQPTDNWQAGYRQIEKAVREGKVKAIGLSNFSEAQIQEVIDFAEYKPQMVQVEAHPYFPQTELKHVLAQTEMGLMAWYPLGHGDKSLLEQPIFASLAEKYGKSVAQIILRWHIQSCHVVIPGSRNAAHIKENIDIFDFQLTDQEMAQIGLLDNQTRYYNGTAEQIAAYKTMTLDFEGQE